MKNCDLCYGLARMHCESDNATLCWDCDAKVHSANFLAARHSRCLLCQVCQSPTAWSASGAKIGPTLSVCDRCVDGNLRDKVDERESVNDEESETEDEDEDESDDEDEIDSEDIQVVPWSPPPPPPASPSSSEDLSNGDRNVTLKRVRENYTDLHSDLQDDSGSSSCRRKVLAPSLVTEDGSDNVTAAVVDSCSSRMRTPAKIQRTEAIMEFMRRNNRQMMRSSSTIAQICRLTDDSRTVDLETPKTS